MRFFLLVLSLCFSWISCSTTAGVNVGPGQKFMLGEGMTKAYKARLANVSTQTVDVALVDKGTGTEARTVTLAAGKRTVLKVDPQYFVELRNMGTSESLIKARLNRPSVPGMRYTSSDEAYEPQQPQSWLDTDEGGAKPSDKPRFPHAYPVEIAPLSTYAFAKTQAVAYSAIVRNQGSPNVNVRVVDRTTGKQTQGFGMGARSKPIVNVSATEMLTLVNRSLKPASLQLELNVELDVPSSSE